MHYIKEITLTVTNLAMNLESTNKERLELREKNEKAWNGDVYVPAGKLDSSLKKNTAFIKKIKISLNAENHLNALKDIETLSLEKYLSEVATSMEETILKVSKGDDIMASMKVISLLHQRFPGQITLPLLSVMVNEILQKDKSESSSRIKNALKLIFEMYLVGLCSTFSQCKKDTLSDSVLQLCAKFKDEMMIIPILKDVMSYNPSTGFSLPIIVLFLKRYGFILKDDQNLIADELRTGLKDLFILYTNKLIEVLKSHHSKIASLIKKDKKASIKTGRVLDYLQDGIQKGVETETLMTTNISILCEILKIEMAQLDDGQEQDDSEVIISSNESTKTWWEDSKEKNFYKEIPTLDDILSDLSTSLLPESDLATLRDADKVVMFLQQMEAVCSEVGVNKLVKIFLKQIPKNKATNNRLLRFFAAVPKVDNIKFFARYLKITNELYPELINELVETLDRRFRSQMYHGSINFRNLYFFIELIKFNLIPSHVVFHKIHKMTLNIAGTSNADLLLIFYERCGKFLLFEPNYLDTTKEMLTLLHQQSKSERLSINEKLSLRNMFLIVDSFTAPKPVKNQTFIERTPVEDFTIQLIRMTTPTNHMEVAGILKKYASEAEVQSAMLYVYLRPEELPLDRLQSLASVLGHLGGSNSSIIYRVCDTLVEKVIRGLELNDYRQNIARTAQIKLLAALCNRTVMSFRSALDLLFKILCFGYANNLPLPNSNLSIDMPDDYFRIHLVCSFLKASSMGRLSNANLFKHGAKSVEGLLVFLQYYIFCKHHPIPKDIQFSIEDSFAAFNQYSPNRFERALDLSSAMIALQKYTSSVRDEEAQTQEVEAYDESDEFDSEIEVSEDGYNSGSDVELEESDGELEVESKIVDEDLDSDSDSETLDDDNSSGEEDDEHDHHIEKDFEALELEKKHAQSLDDSIRELMNESIQHSRTAAPFKVPAPSTFLASDTNKAEGPMRFTFLTKKNQLKELSLPSNNQFAERIEREQAAQRANRAKILSLINNMHS